MKNQKILTSSILLESWVSRLLNLISILAHNSNIPINVFIVPSTFHVYAFTPKEHMVELHVFLENLI